MKTSKYISIAFIVFMISTILIMYIDAKPYYKINNRIHVNNDYKKKNRPTSNTGLEDFSILVAAKNTKISVVSDSIVKLEEYYYFPQDTIKNPLAQFDKKIDYRINGDTLFIDKTYARSVIVFTKNLKELIAKKDSDIHLFNIKTKKLTITSKKSNIHGDNNFIKNLKLTITNNSKINLFDSTIDTIKLYSDASKIDLKRILIKRLDADLNNKSRFNTSKAYQLHIETDNNSKYYFN